MQKDMEHDMETVVLKRDPSIQILPILGPKVCWYYPHWAIWILGVGFRGWASAFRTVCVEPYHGLHAVSKMLGCMLLHGL